MERKAAMESKTYLTTEELAKKLGEFTCNISRKVGEQDKLFGSVSAVDIADANDPSIHKHQKDRFAFDLVL